MPHDCTVWRGCSGFTPFRARIRCCRSSSNGMGLLEIEKGPAPACNWYAMPPMTRWWLGQRSNAIDLTSSQSSPSVPVVSSILSKNPTRSTVYISRRYPTARLLCIFLTLHSSSFAMTHLHGHRYASRSSVTALLAPLCAEAVCKAGGPLQPGHVQISAPQTSSFSVRNTMYH